ncbi:MAG: hypothetical protein JWP57_3036 [Spirosoma sp.]|nr:hypothetical protein [Spirosoma sp.]
MKKTLIALLTLFSIYGYSQSPVSTRLSSGYELGMAYSIDHYNPSLGYYQVINIGERKLISFGWTARLGAFYGDNINYYTAPARLTRGETGLGALSAPLITNNIDTLRFDLASMTSLNVGVRLQFNLGRVELGASADLLGLTLGRRRTAIYRSSTGRFATGDSVSAPFQGANALQRAHPSYLNLRLLGDNDRGTLSTEVYVRFHLGQRLAVKGGYQWLTSEYTVLNRDIIADNNRFRNRSGMVYLGLTFPIFY